MKYHYLDVWFEEQVAYVLLNQTKSSNQLEAGIAQELVSIARELDESENVKAIILGGKGEDFSSGVSTEGNYMKGENATYDTVSLISRAIEAWARLPYPIIAVIQGQCSSLGFSLACVADLRYVASGACFSMPETTWGLVPAGGITQRLPRLIGKGPAMSVLLGGESVTADKALELGLANRLLEEDNIWNIACEEGERLKNMSAFSTQFTKECMLKGSDMPFDQALRLELDIYMLLQTSEDRMEGVNAFLEKRTPQFKGQ